MEEKNWTCIAGRKKGAFVLGFLFTYWPGGKVKINIDFFKRWISIDRRDPLLKK